METIDRNEIEEPRVTSQPECWPHKQAYYTCRVIFKKKVDKGRWPWSKPIVTDGAKGTWAALYYTAEDAEAHAAIRDPNTIWDGSPAEMITLKAAMYEVRRDERLGIQVRSFQDGKWKTVREYKSTEPLPEEW